jgi:ubiquinone/menaquinone biosynthesis C-methylase UbiE
MLTESEQNSRVLDQFDKQAASYAALVRDSKDTTLPMLLDAVKPSATDRLLDVGCGSGRFAIQWAPLVAQVIGVDLTPAMLAQAAQLQAATQIKNIEWRQADVTQLPFADGEFNVVSCSAMLHHVVSPMRVIAEMRRVCVPGGRIIAKDMTPKLEKSAAANAIEVLRDPSHLYAMTNAELRAIGAALGLEEIAVQESQSRMPLEAVLRTSFPHDGMLDQVRRLFRLDAESGVDALGFGAHLDNGEVHLLYPMTTVVWHRGYENIK